MLLTLIAAKNYINRQNFGGYHFTYINHQKTHTNSNMTTIIHVHISQQKMQQ